VPPTTSPIHISVLGAGRVGRALGGRWTDVGHQVAYGVRDPGDARWAELTGVATPIDAVAGADVVLVALPWTAVEPVLTGVDVGDAVVIDATNPIAAGARQLEAHPEGSGAELVARWSRSSRVVKAFNTTGSGNMIDPVYPGGTLLMPVAADDPEAKAAVMRLATEIGFDALDAGPLAAARDLEHLAALWIRLAYRLANGPDIAFALLRR
jgi:8-hydroxy-5-deazaflavin:NADPH oxidoreductase